MKKNGEKDAIKVTKKREKPKNHPVALKNKRKMTGKKKLRKKRPKNTNGKKKYYK